MDDPVTREDECLFTFTQIDALEPGERERAHERAQEIADQLEGIDPEVARQMSLFALDLLLGLEREFSPHNVERKLRAHEQGLRAQLDCVRAELGALRLLRAERAGRESGAPDARPGGGAP